MGWGREQGVEDTDVCWGMGGGGAGCEGFVGVALDTVVWLFAHWGFCPSNT